VISFIKIGQDLSELLIFSLGGSKEYVILGEILRWVKGQFGDRFDDSKRLGKRV
jgi:hypothetical protein